MVVESYSKGLTIRKVIAMGKWCDTLDWRCHCRSNRNPWDRCVIEFNQVSKNYFALTALHDITLTIPSGEVVGLLGPNGAGKTTLIKLIAGIIAPSKGEIRTTHIEGQWPTIGYKPVLSVIILCWKVWRGSTCSQPRTNK